MSPTIVWCNTRLWCNIKTFDTKLDLHFFTRKHNVTKLHEATTTDSEIFVKIMQGFPILANTVYDLDENHVVRKPNFMELTHEENECLSRLTHSSGRNLQSDSKKHLEERSRVSPWGSWVPSPQSPSKQENPRTGLRLQAWTCRCCSGQGPPWLPASVLPSAAWEGCALRSPLPPSTVCRRHRKHCSPSPGVHQKHRGRVSPRRQLELVAGGWV